MTIRGAYTAFKTLAQLPTLVRKQRRLEHRIATVADDLEREKAVRTQIDELLVAAGLAKSEGVTCLGYDVVHHERAGQKRINGEELLKLLVAGGVDEEFAASAIAEATKEDERAKFATVRPSKGAKVRAA